MIFEIAYLFFPGMEWQKQKIYKYLSIFLFQIDGPFWKELGYCHNFKCKMYGLMEVLLYCLCIAEMKCHDGNKCHYHIILIGSGYVLSTSHLGIIIASDSFKIPYDNKEVLNYISN